jgi:hypothetical protein
MMKADGSTPWHSLEQEAAVTKNARGDHPAMGRPWVEAAGDQPGIPGDNLDPTVS